MPPWMELLNFTVNQFKFRVSKGAVWIAAESYLEHQIDLYKDQLINCSSTAAAVLLAEEEFLFSDIKSLFCLLTMEDRLQMQTYFNEWKESKLELLTATHF